MKVRADAPRDAMQEIIADGLVDRQLEGVLQNALHNVNIGSRIALLGLT